MAITAIIVPVLEAQALVGDLSSRFDGTTASGVPPYITILAPFMAPKVVSVCGRQCMSSGFQRKRTNRRAVPFWSNAAGSAVLSLQDMQRSSMPPHHACMKTARCCDVTATQFLSCSRRCHVGEW